MNNSRRVRDNDRMDWGADPGPANRWQDAEPVTVEEVEFLRMIWRNNNEISEIFDSYAMPDYIIACLVKHLTYPRRVKLVCFFWFNGVSLDLFFELIQLCRANMGHRRTAMSQQQREQMADLWNNGLNAGRYHDT